MAAASTIEIEVLAQTRQAVAALNSLTERFGGLGSFLRGMAAQVTAAFSVAAVVRFTDAAISGMAALDNMSKQTGISVETLSAMQAAAGKTGMSLGSLNTGVTIFARNLANAAQSGGAAAEFFRRFTGSLTDAEGRMRPTEQLLDRFIRRFNELPDSQKAAAAMEGFGRGGREFVELLAKMGSISQATADAIAEGSIVTAQQAEAADAYEKSIGALKNQTANLWREVAGGVLPHLQQFVNWLLESQRSSGLLSGAAQTLIQIFKGLASALFFVFATGQSLYSLVKNNLVMMFQNFMQVGEATGRVFASFYGILEEVIGSLVRLIRRVGEVGSVMGYVSAGEWTEAWKASKGIFAGIADDAAGAGKKIKDHLGDAASALGESGMKIWGNTKNAIVNSATEIAGAFKSAWEKSAALFGPAAPMAGTTAAAPAAPGPVTVSESSRKLLEEIEKMYRAATMRKLELLDAEEAELKSRVDREITNIKDAEEAKTKLTEVFARRRREILDKESAARTEIESAGLKGRIDLLGNDPLLTDAAKTEQLLPLLERQRDLMAEQLDINRARVTDPQLSDEAHLEAQKELLRVEQERAAVTQRINDLNSQGFSGTFKRGMVGLANSWSLAKNLGQGALDALQMGVQGLSNGIMGLIQGTQSFGKVFSQIGLQILSMMIQMVIQALILKLLLGPLGFSGGGGVGFSGGGIVHAADGGFISGPGTGRSDSIPAWLSNGEFVVNAAATASNRPLLESINSGVQPMQAQPVKVIVMNSEAEYRRWARSEGVEHTLQVIGGNKRRLGVKA